MNLRRYHSELAIDQAGGSSSLAKYPTIAERGVPEGQEDPEGPKERPPPEQFLQKAVLRRKLLMGDQPKTPPFPATKDKRHYLDWAKQKWEDLNLVPFLPHLSRTNLSSNLPQNEPLEVDVLQTEESLQTLLTPIEMNPNERYKVLQRRLNIFIDLNEFDLIVAEFQMFHEFLFGKSSLKSTRHQPNDGLHRVQHQH